MRKEIWKTCPSFPSAEASSLGNVRIDGQPRKPTLSGNGYLTVTFGGKNILVQWFVSDAFLGPRPDGFDVCHKDDVRINNVPSNLEYASRSKNLLDRWDNGTSFGKSNYLGVTFSRREGKWKAYYDGGQKRVWLGTHLTEEAAAKAVDAYMISHNIDRRRNLCTS